MVVLRYFIPKQIERQQSQQRDEQITADHEHTTFTNVKMKVPSKWRNVINCRRCKRLLVICMGDALLRLGSTILENDQKLYILQVLGC